MPRFFFDFDDGETTIADDRGIDLPDPHGASREAIAALAAITKDVLPDGPERILRVTMRDEGGRPIYSATLAFKGGWLPWPFAEGCCEPRADLMSIRSVLLPEKGGHVRACSTYTVSMPMTALKPRKGMPVVKLDKATFRERYLEQFTDPAFDEARAALDQIAGIAWDAYADSRKAPRTEKAGPGFADPAYDLAKDWLEAKTAIDQAQRQFGDVGNAPRILIVNGSPRSEHTCPGEMSKSWRLLEIAEQTCRSHGVEVDILDLSRVTSEYGRNIHPCKACFSTTAALCHWPCSCYPNHSLGQTQDWMNEIYPLWVAASGVMIISPVHWYQAPTPLKAMIDRLVCADGGNPDPTSTHGKDAEKGKELELADWPYPKHLQGRLFSIVIHGDTEGVENARRALSDWMKAMDMVPAGARAEVDRYIDYYGPYATSHEALDRDEALQAEVRNAALTLIDGVQKTRNGKLLEAGADLSEPRKK